VTNFNINGMLSLEEGKAIEDLKVHLDCIGSSHHAQVLGSKLLGVKHCDADSENVSSCRFQSATSQLQVISKQDAPYWLP